MRPRRRRSWLLGALVVSSGACATISPMPPRFVAVADQRGGYCRIQVIRDTRSLACFVAFQCGRHPVTVLTAAPEVCVP